jgi:DHA1 family bicyclomycin/chloramphenicol resistance-like MFS transporter
MKRKPFDTKTPSIILLAALTGITALSIDMNLPAMPELQEVFGVSVSAVQLTLSLFLAGFAIGQLACGPLSDRFGRRPVLLTGLAVFSVAGLICAAGVSLPMLVAGRFVQGLGASAGPIIARAVVRDCFNSREASSVLSRITQVMIIAPLIAPTLGGYLLVSFGWSSIFIVLGLCGSLLLVVGWLRLPETLAQAESARDGSRTNSLGRDFAGVLAHRSSLRHTLTAAFSYAGMFAYISGSPFVLIDVFKVAEHNFGYFFALTALAVMLGASANRFLVKKVSPSVLLRGGVYLLTVAGILLAILVSFNVGGLAGVMLPMMIYMFGLGLVQPNATSAAMAPHGRLAGLSSSLIGSLQTAGGALTGFCVGAFYNHTPLSLGVVVAIMSVLTFLIYERRQITEFHTESPDADLVPEISVATTCE